MNYTLVHILLLVCLWFMCRYLLYYILDIRKINMKLNTVRYVCIHNNGQSEKALSRTSKITNVGTYYYDLCSVHNFLIHNVITSHIGVIFSKLMRRI